MGDLTANFNRSEFACKCEGKYCDGSLSKLDMRFAHAMQRLREFIGQPLTITSGIRCKEWNRLKGGTDQSYHQWGVAADVFCVSDTLRYELVVRAAPVCQFHGVGVSPTFVHFDMRRLVNPNAPATMWLYPAKK